MRKLFYVLLTAAALSFSANVAIACNKCHGKCHCTHKCQHSNCAHCKHKGCHGHKVHHENHD